MEGCWRLRHSSWGAMPGLTRSQTLSLGPSAGAAAQKAPGTLWGGSELPTFRVKAGGAEVRAALSWDGSSFAELSPCPAHPAQAATNLCSLLTWTNTVHSQPEPLPVAFWHEWSAASHTIDFPQISQRSTNTKQAVAALGVPCTSS